MSQAVHAPVLRSLRVRVLCWMLAVAFLLSAGDRTLAQATDEYRVKAAFLFHFAQLVDWPASALGDEKQPLTLCTIGKDPFGGNLEATLQGKFIGARALQIRHLKQREEFHGCHVLFVSNSERKEVVPLLAALRDEPILTVGESGEFVKQGGMIDFCMENSKVRFDINVDAALRVNLKISSRLLLLAKNVIGNHS